MNVDEHILDYIDRIKDLHQAIYDEERYRTRELTEEQQNEIDEFTLNSFCDGLPFEYSLKITAETCENLLDIFAKARHLYTRKERDSIRRQTHQQSQIPRIIIRTNIVSLNGNSKLRVKNVLVGTILPLLDLLLLRIDHNPTHMIRKKNIVTQNVKHSTYNRSTAQSLYNYYIIRLQK
ncbi:uncharacterized protein V1478_012559 [Vespula squamosa]|uniref:Uncharacterized protein n=1 Tax=Vespula squamosa TaxID=30214 RepID=A0ABD2ADI0_VESSQ